MSDRVCYSHRTCALVRWGGDEGNRTPNPRLAKRDQPYQALPANVVLCVLVLLTRCPTAPVVNERQRFCRLFADFTNTGTESTVSGRSAVLICDRPMNLRATSKPALWELRSGVAVVVVPGTSHRATGGTPPPAAAATARPETGAGLAAAEQGKRDARGQPEPGSFPCRACATWQHRAT